jgi:DNA-binding MarR family transcriptional regulator
VVDDDLRRGLLKLSSDVLQGTMRAAEAIEPTVTPAQLRVLALLADTGPSSVSAVASALGVAVSTASRLADRLNGAGLLTRQVGPDSRREVELTLTRRGRLVAQRWADARIAVLADLLEQLESPARELVEQGLRTTPAGHPQGSGSSAAGSRGDTAASAATWSHPDVTATACHDLSTALRDADPHRAPDVLVLAVATALSSDAVALRVLSPDGRVLRPVSWTGVQEELSPQDESVDRSPAGRALRTDDPVVEVDGDAVLVHAPVSTAGRCVAVLTVRWHGPDDADGEAGGSPERAAAEGRTASGADAGADDPPAPWLDLLLALAATAGLVLPSVSVGSRRMHLAARVQEWTVAAEVQRLQSGPACVTVDGVQAAAHTEPSASGGAEAHDLEVVTLPPRRGVGSHAEWTVHLDVAVLDCRSQGRQAAGVTGLALGALRHARSLGLDPGEQARLVDQAVFGEYHGEVVVDVLLLRVEFEPWRVQALASSGATVHRQRGSASELVDLAESDPLGLTGEADYRTVPVDLARGDRVLLIGDGFGPLPARGRRRVDTVVNRSRGLSAGEVVRQVITDLLDLSGADGPEEDATIVCLDL